jgi:multiple sugar transport system permease protein
MSSLVKSTPSKIKFGQAGFFQYLVMGLIILIIFVPLLIIVLASMKTLPEISQMTPLVLPHSFYLGNFAETFVKAKIILSLVNSFTIALSSVIINAFIGAMAAFILARFDFKFKKIVYGMFLVAMIIPYYTVEVARFQLIKSMGLYNTLYAPILIYIGADMMQIFVYKQYMDKISVSLDESAMLDGASYLKIFTKIIFPLIIPAVATLAIIKFVDITNDMYIPYLYIPSDKYRTLTTTLMTFAGDRSVNWASISACIIWILIPTLLVYFSFQKYILKGITAGSIKE